MHTPHTYIDTHTHKHTHMHTRTRSPPSPGPCAQEAGAQAWPCGRLHLKCPFAPAGSGCGEGKGGGRRFAVEEEGAAGKTSLPHHLTTSAPFLSSRPSWPRQCGVRQRTWVSKGNAVSESQTQLKNKAPRYFLLSISYLISPTFFTPVKTPLRAPLLLD